MVADAAGLAPAVAPLRRVRAPPLRAARVRHLEEAGSRAASHRVPLEQLAPLALAPLPDGPSDRRQAVPSLRDRGVRLEPHPLARARHVLAEAASPRARGRQAQGAASATRLRVRN